jgi:hypothetical protein
MPKIAGLPVPAEEANGDVGPASVNAGRVRSDDRLVEIMALMRGKP